MPTKDYNDKSGLAYYWLEENIGRVLLVALFAGIGLWGLLLEDITELRLIPRLARGMGPELAGIVIVAVTIEALAERRQEAERKKTLISQLGSMYRDVTEIALIDLRNREWLYDGSLSGILLMKANLSGAHLRGANLSEADLSEANLSGAGLWRANLNGADLLQADLSGAGLMEANLNGAHVLQANLSGVGLREANLSGVKSWTIEQLEQAETLEGAIMPDEIQLGQKAARWWKHIEGFTFEEWKVQYLAKHGSAESDIRGTHREPDNSANEQPESGSPESS